MFVRTLSLLVLLQLTPLILCLQFGFFVNDDKMLLKKRFVAFGILPDGISHKIKSEVFDLMHDYIRAEIHRRTFEGIDRVSFLTEPIALNTMKNGRSLLGLKGELWTFMNLFRFSCKRILPAQSYWKDIIFFSQPIIVLDFNEMFSFEQPFEITLIEPGFNDEDKDMFQDLLRRDTTISQASDDQTPLIPITENESSPKFRSIKCDCECNIT